MTENKVVPFRRQFSDIRSDFEYRLEKIVSELDAKTLATDISSFLNGSPDLSEARKSELKSLRQKVYDRKRKLPLSKPSEPIQPVSTKLQIKTPINTKVEENFSINETTTPTIEVKNRSSHFLNIAQRVTVAILFIGFAITSMWFVFVQSIPLYQAIGFPNPRFCAAGAILMMGAFALFHWFTKSKVLLLLCLFVSSYEVVLVVRGTATHEIILSQEKIEKDGNLIWLKEDADQKKESYDTLKIKYEDPSSKVYKNGWYKKKFLDPAWQEYSLVEEKINGTENKLSKIHKANLDITILKIL